MSTQSGASSTRMWAARRNRRFVFVGSSSSMRSTSARSGRRSGEPMVRGAHALLDERLEGAHERELVGRLDLAARVDGAVEVDEPQLALAPLDAPAVDRLDRIPGSVRAAPRARGCGGSPSW